MSIVHQTPTRQICNWNVANDIRLLKSF